MHAALNAVIEGCQAEMSAELLKSSSSYIQVQKQAQYRSSNGDSTHVCGVCDAHMSMCAFGARAPKGGRPPSARFPTFRALSTNICSYMSPRALGQPKGRDTGAPDGHSCANVRQQLQPLAKDPIEGCTGSRARCQYTMTVYSTLAGTYGAL